MNTKSPALALSLPLLAWAPQLCGSAEAQTFTVIASIPAGPAIGALSGRTLYGTTPQGGAGKGTVFSLTTAGRYTLITTFPASGAHGFTPNALLGLDPKGNIIGTAQGGGAYLGGTLWRTSPSGTFTLLHAFGNGTDGTDPLQGPVVDRQGAIFGSTAMGAINTNGNVFRATTPQKYKVLYDFMSESDGHCPFSGVARGQQGTLYGTTVGLGFGGNPNGSVWQLTTDGTLTTLHAFLNGNDGEWPMQAPVLDNKGNLYGTTEYQNGALFAGAVWKIDTRGKFSVLHDFNQATEGGQPNSPLIVNTDGKLYGTASSGGSGGYGTVYRLTGSGTLTVQHSFANGNDGAVPTGNLVNDSKGAVYGGTQSGQVFKIVP